MLLHAHAVKVFTGGAIDKTINDTGAECLPDWASLKTKAKAKFKCRQCVYDVQKHFYCKIYCKHWERERGIMK